MPRTASRRAVLIGGACSVLTGCADRLERASPAFDANPSFESFDRGFARVVDTGASPRILGDGYRWSEGPAWDNRRKFLYFTDVPANKAYRWSEAGGIDVFLDPSGTQGSVAGLREPGANGLLVARSGRLLVCNHGERRLEALNLESGERSVLASTFNGRRFNSPNDVIEAPDGTVYFTDPPYGLDGLDASPLKEQDANGVYRLSPKGGLVRLVDWLTFPNGLAIAPDGRTLYISQSDPAAPYVYALDLEGTGQPSVWFDARPFMESNPGLPDGMAVAETGHVFLAGPGGVLVIDPAGNCLGRIATGRATANCAFGEDGRTLFVTAQDRLLSVRTLISGLGTNGA